MSTAPHYSVYPAQQPNPVRRRSPRLQTFPPITIEGSSTRIHKRIIVCCDGTWQDGIVSKKRWQYSNILKLSRMVNHQDDRETTPIPQIVFYQAGVGSEHNIYSEYIEGATGASLGEKVQEAYAFIAHNYQYGDEIFLFGFSRGAYTARMAAALIGEIGVLDRKDMDHFASIFIAYEKLGNMKDKKEIAESKRFLEPFTHPKARGRVRADANGDKFTIKCLGVFDTVGSMGLPEELRLSRKIKQLFGFPDRFLGDHIENAFQAMALNETRADFDVTRFEQTQKGRERGQILRQMWFPGCHSDVGGGYQSHDLSDITLTWMASNIEHVLSIDTEYLKGIPQPIAPWGIQPPHDPETGIFKLCHSIKRTLPSETNNITHEYIHPSVMKQKVVLPEVAVLISKHPSIVASLAPLEEEFKELWPYIPGQTLSEGEDVKEANDKSIFKRNTLLGRAKTVMGLRRQTMRDEGGKPRYERTWLGAIIHQISL